MNKSGLKEGEDWFEPNQSLMYIYPFPTPLPQFFYLPVFNFVAKRKLLFGEEDIGGGKCPHPPCYTYDGSYRSRGTSVSGTVQWTRTMVGTCKKVKRGK